MKYWRFDESPDEKQLDEIGRLLSAGGVVLMPTDTIYGLHAPATNERAVRAIVNMKRRDDLKPFVVLGHSIEQIESIGVHFKENIRESLSKIWPAPLTAILPLERPVAAARGRSTLAVRIPATSWLREILMRSGPLVSTSANESGASPIESPSQLSSDVATQLDGIVDGGVRNGSASAIVDFSESEPRLVREGEALFTQEMWKTLRKSL